MNSTTAAATASGRPSAIALAAGRAISNRNGCPDASDIPQRARFATSSRKPTSSITSPAATAASPSRNCAIATGSESTSRVSSNPSRSSGLINTAAGRPLRVTSTRS